MDTENQNICHVRFCRPIPKLVTKSEFEKLKESYTDKEWAFYIECVEKHYWSKGWDFPIDD